MANDRFSTLKLLYRMVRVGQSVGLPVRFIREVLKSSYIILPTSGDADTAEDGSLMELTRWRLDSLRNPIPSASALPFEGTGIGMLYHECTHAYLFLHKSDWKVRMMMSRVKKHYSRGRLVDGSPITDPFRVAHEAASVYVGQKALTWWIALSSLNDWKKNRKIHIWDVRDEYNRQNIKGRYGYQMAFDVRGWVQVQAAMPIEPRLKVFCDSLLEWKIPDQFDAVPQFRRFIRDMPKYVAPPSEGVSRRSHPADPRL